MKGGPRGPDWAANRHRKSYAYKRARAIMFAMHGGVGRATCHLCGHLGAGVADHVVPVALAPDQPVSPWGLKPAHGRGYPCRECPPVNGRPRHCNERRGIKAVTTPVESVGRARLKTSRDWDSGGRDDAPAYRPPEPPTPARPPRPPRPIVSGRPPGGGAVSGMKNSQRW